MRIKALLAAFGRATLLASGSAAQVALDLRDAKLRDFVQIVSESTGRNFILDSQVQGNVTVMAPGTLSREAVYEIFLNVLELNRLTIVEGDQADRIVPIDIARELAPGARGADQGGAFETRVIQVHEIAAEEAAEVIRPLLPPEAVLSVVPEAGQIILSDRRENFERIARLVQRLDMPRRRGGIETVRLSNASAADLLPVLQSLGIVPAGASISADPRANAIIASGPEAFLAELRDLVRQLDLPQRSIATSVVQLNYAEAESLVEVIRESFGGSATGEGGLPAGAPTIVAEPQRNVLIVSAPADRIGLITDAIRALDTRPSQVLIEAVIFELSVENFSDLSVQFGAVLDDAIVGGVEFSLAGRPSLTSLVTTVLQGGTVVSPGAGGFLAGSETTGDFGFAGFLSALTSQGSTRLLSTPSILTLNNQEAEIVVAQNVPFVTGSFATVGDSAIPEQPFQTIERQDVGLTLRVTPQISADDTVRLAIAQEVSNLTNSASAAGSEITAKRTLSTNVLVRNGHVIMLGGLLEDGSGSAQQKVPGLGDAPVIGALFRGRNVSESQRILLVMLRPRILGDDAAAERATREMAREARRASEAIEPRDDGRFPRLRRARFPFDGANLDQPFDSSFIDDMARERQFPPLPSRLEFR